MMSAKDLVDRLGVLTQILNDNIGPNPIKPFKKKNNRKKNKINKKDHKLKQKNKIAKEPEMENNNQLANAVTSPFQISNKYHSTSSNEEIFIKEDLDYSDSQEAQPDIPRPKIQRKQAIGMKANKKSFLIQLYFRRWQKAFQVRGIRNTIKKKITNFHIKEKKEKKKTPTPQTQQATKKISKAEQLEALDRLTKLNIPHSPRKPPENQLKKPNQAYSNSQFKPKTEGEMIKIQRRRLIKQITSERDENEQDHGEKITQKSIMNTVKRLSKPKPQQKEPSKPKPDISHEEQLENAIRLAVPKPVIEEPRKKINRLALPTKKEQLEIAIRLAQPKPDHTPRVMKKHSKYTIAEQKEICERLATPKKIISKPSDDEVIPNEDNNIALGVKEKKKKKKLHKRKYRKNKKLIDNIEKTANVPPTPQNTQPVLTPTSSRKVRFNGIHSEKRPKGEKSLSQQLNEVLDYNSTGSTTDTAQSENDTPHKIQNSSSCNIDSDGFSNSPPFKTVNEDLSEVERETLKDISELKREIIENNFDNNESKNESDGDDEITEEMNDSTFTSNIQTPKNHSKTQSESPDSNHFLNSKKIKNSSSEEIEYLFDETGL